MYQVRFRFSSTFLCVCTLTLLFLCDGVSSQWEEILSYCVNEPEPGNKFKIQSKVDCLGEVFKEEVNKLRQSPGQNLELVFLVDASGSVGIENFQSELKFVKKLLADFPVSYSQTRVAVITYSDSSKIIRNVDHITHASSSNHKCSLFLNNIVYTGGSTYTLGAIMEAQSVLSSSRSNAMKAVFLVTDGYSNGGDPINAAEILKSTGVILFTIGVQNGNVQELYTMASEPKKKHTYILDSFQEFEQLARRALHKDLNNGMAIPQDMTACSGLCNEVHGCCDESARCTCGTNTGRYSCLCKLGFYGTGFKGNCEPCPPGTYRNTDEPNDVKGCKSCPDKNMLSLEASTSQHQCYCKKGYTQKGLRCQKVKCLPLTVPANGLPFRNCETDVNSVCSVRCQRGYRLEGSANRTCQEDGTWSEGNTTCVMKTCKALGQPKNGVINCSSENYTNGTRCSFTCNLGYKFKGPKKRTCEGTDWTGKRGECKPLTCYPVKPEKNTFVTPTSCSRKPLVGTTCKFTCAEGYKLTGPSSISCTTERKWTSFSRTAKCIDVTAPVIQCPPNKKVTTKPNENYALVTLDSAKAKDNSNKQVKIRTQPVVKKPMKFPIGSHTITFIAKDRSKNKANCTMVVTVQDEEPPKRDSCKSPPAFVSRAWTVDVFWEEPVFSDNSGGDLTINENEKPGLFQQGKTDVVYSATDPSGNTAFCNITIQVQKHLCTLPSKPSNGRRNCTEKQDKVYCKVSCKNGYAFVEKPKEIYSCAYDGVWLPKSRTNPFRFPDCSASSMPTTTVQEGEMEFEDDGSVCNNTFLMEQLQENVRKKFEEKLSEVCANSLCRIGPVEVLCEDYLAESEESNSLNPHRGKRNVNQDVYIHRFWRKDDRPSNWIYLRRGTPSESISEGVKTDISKSLTSQKQFTFPMGIFKGKEMNDTLVKKRNEENFSFMEEQQSANQYAIASDKLNENSVTVVHKSDEQADETYSSVRFPRETMPHPNSHFKTSKRKFKVKFQVQGHGSKAPKMIENVFKDRLKLVDDVSVIDGERRLKMKGITILTNLTYTCDAGKVLVDDLCVNCPVGAFFSMNLKECQPCPFGLYQPKEGQISCLSCPEKTSTKSEGAKSNQECKAMCSPGFHSSDTLEPCSTCPLGEYQDEYASSSCSPCPSGTTTWRTGSRSIEECKAVCPPGKASKTGLKPCLACPLNSFQNETGQTKCLSCPGDSYTLSGGSTSLFDCNGITKISQGAYTSFEEQPFNDCFSAPCMNGGSCRLLKFGHTCECPDEYTGQYCEIEWNECLSYPCFNNATCEDQLGSFKCVCAVGFQGELCKVNINECDPNPCQNSAHCVDLIDSFKCNCESGFTGKTCETTITECDSAPCSSGSTCVDRFDDYSCLCPPGFEGRNCNIEINECESLPCIHGICSDIIDDFKCSCNPGYSGKQCNVDIDECESQPCQNNGTCTDLLNEFSCACVPAFTGKVCETKMSADFTLEFPSSALIKYASVENLRRVLESVTICFWMKTHDTENYGTPFSYATETQDNALTLLDYSGFVFYVNGEDRVTDVSADDGEWHMICVMWSAEDGYWSIFKDGVEAYSGKGLSEGKPIEADGVFVLGQEQDQRDGNYSAQESFTGDLALLNVWGYALPKDKINSLYNKCSRYDGDIISWPDFQAVIGGQIKVKNLTFCSGCGILHVPQNAGIVREQSSGNVARVICDEGYELDKGDEERICLTYGEWSGEEAECKPCSPGTYRNTDEPNDVKGCKSCPDVNMLSPEASTSQHQCYCKKGYTQEGLRCQKVECLPLTLPANGLPFRNCETDVNSVCSVRCQHGYRLEGSANRTCQEDGTWSEGNTTCVIKTCKALRQPENGVMNCSSENYTNGTRCSFTCNLGYKFEGPTKRTCEGTDWTGKRGECKPISCDFPGTLRDRHTKIVKFSFGKVLTFICNKGFRLVGSATRKCQADRKWSGGESKCQIIKCPDPTPMENGVVISHLRSYLPTKRVLYSCKEGYQMDGLAYQTCGSSGSWKGDAPSCQRLKCGEMPKVLYGTVTEASDSRTATVTCDFGYKTEGTSTILCQEDGTWSKSIPECIQAKCEKPPLIENGNVEVEGKALYSCVEGYRMEGRASLNCQSDELWDGDPPKCVQVDCGPAPFSADLILSGNSTVYASKVNYSCDKGYRLEGKDWTTCLQSGRWSNKVPRCDLVICALPPEPVNGFRQENAEESERDEHSLKTKSRKRKQKSKSRRERKRRSESRRERKRRSKSSRKRKQIRETKKYVAKKVYVVDDEITYNCNLGWKISGESTLKCTQEGTWSSEPPKCERISCGPPEIPEHAKYFSSKGNNFLYGEIQLSCEEGYVLRGNPVIKCTEDGTWTDDSPLCEPMNCGSPPFVSNSHVSYEIHEHVSRHNFDSVVIYTCNEGYILEGSLYMTCDASGKWISPREPPICVEMPCEDPPVVPHARAHEEKRKKLQMATYTCDPGYVLSGDDSIFCSLGRWKRLNMLCNPVNCYRPVIPMNGKITAKHFLLGSVANYSCIAGYELKGNPSVYCDVTGRWIGDIPECHPFDCGTPKSPLNGIVSVFNNEATYYCDHGHELKGNSTRACSQDGSWSGYLPQCRRVNCGELQPPAEGFVIGAGQLFGDEVKFACNKGHVLIDYETSVCQADGTWSITNPKCEGVSCRELKPLAKGFIIGTGQLYGDEVKFACDKGYKLIGNKISVCQADGTWSVRNPKCEALCHPPCQNGGMCTGPRHCTCLRGYAGSYCQTPTCGHKCGRYGQCIGPNLCLCRYGETAESCQEDSEATHFSDWDIAALRRGRLRLPRRRNLLLQPPL